MKQRILGNSKVKSVKSEEVFYVGALNADLFTFNTLHTDSIESILDPADPSCQCETAYISTTPYQSHSRSPSVRGGRHRSFSSSPNNKVELPPWVHEHPELLNQGFDVDWTWSFYLTLFNS